MSLYGFLLSNKTLVLAFVTLFLGRFLAVECGKRAAVAVLEEGRKQMDDFRRQSDLFMQGGNFPGRRGRDSIFSVQQDPPSLSSGWVTAAAFFQLLVAAPAGLTALFSICVHLYAAF